MNGYAQDRLRDAGAKSKRARYVIQRSPYFDFASLRSIRTGVSANFNELPGRTRQACSAGRTTKNHDAMNAVAFIPLSPMRLAAPASKKKPDDIRRVRTRQGQRSSEALGQTIGDGAARSITNATRLTRRQTSGRLQKLMDVGAWFMVARADVTVCLHCGP